MFALALNNIELGVATPPDPVADGAVCVTRIELNREHLELFGLKVGRDFGPFDLVAADRRNRLAGCWFAQWPGMRLEGDLVIIEGAEVQYTSKGGPKAPVPA